MARAPFRSALVALAVVAGVGLASCEVPGPEDTANYIPLSALSWSVPSSPSASYTYWPDSIGDNGVSCEGSSAVDSCVGLDVYLPQGSVTGLRPTVIYVHGGGFFTGDRHEPVASSAQATKFGESIMAQRRPGRDWIVITIDYPLTYDRPGHPMYAYVQQAVRFVKGLDLPGTVDVNPDKVMLAGSSAGGTLALTAALRGDHGSTPTPSVTSTVEGVVNLDGPSSLATLLDVADGEEPFVSSEAALRPMNAAQKLAFEELYGYDIDNESSGTIVSDKELYDAYLSVNVAADSTLSAAELSPFSLVEDSNGRLNDLAFYLACAVEPVPAPPTTPPTPPNPPWPYPGFCSDLGPFHTKLEGLARTGLYEAIDRIENINGNQHHLSIDEHLNTKGLETFLTWFVDS